MGMTPLHTQQTDQIKRSDTTKCGKYIVGTIIYKIDTNKNLPYRALGTLLKTL